MEAKVSTYGGELDTARHPWIETVQHWQLEVDGQFIADTSIPAVAELYRRIAARCND